MTSLILTGLSIVLTAALIVAGWAHSAPSQAFKEPRRQMAEAGFRTFIEACEIMERMGVEPDGTMGQMKAITGLQAPRVGEGVTWAAAKDGDEVVVCLVLDEPDPWLLAQATRSISEQAIRRDENCAESVPPPDSAVAVVVFPTRH